jgi:undecaprenyl pyrophosphate phosphatase UppP
MGPGSGLQAGFTLLVGALSAFVFGWIAISGLIRWVSRVGFEVFAVYRLALGIVVLFWLS